MRRTPKQSRARLARPTAAGTRQQCDPDAGDKDELRSSDVADDLRSRGYAALSGAPTPWYFGSVQALEIDHDARVLSGATDTRREAD